jgi:hypothetical protein
MEEQLQDSIFEKIMPALDAYVLCKLKLQQLRQSSEKFPAIEQEIKYNIKFHATAIEQIIMQDAENQ